MLNGLDLFSGIGGLTIALAPWVSPIAYCERDPYCQAILLSRMYGGDIINAPIWDDVRTLCVDEIPGEVDIVYGGFPCQDRSVAGTRKGLDGYRSRLFFEIIRLAKETKAPFIFVENPRGTKGDADRMLQALNKAGYNTRAGCLEAAAIGANHIRERLWILAYSDRIKLREQSGWRSGESWEGSLLNSWPNRWSRESGISRVANGIPEQMDRNRALGNAVVPLQAREAFKRLMGLK